MFEINIDSEGVYRALEPGTDIIHALQGDHGETGAALRTKYGIMAGVARVTCRELALEPFGPCSVTDYQQLQVARRTPDVAMASSGGSSPVTESRA